MDEMLTWGYPGLMLCGFIAGSCIPMSSEAALSAAIALGWPVWPSLMWVFIGNWLGATTNYMIGRFATLDWIEHWVRIKKTKISYMQHFLQGRGVWLSLISFFPTLGNVLVVCYGISRTPFWKVGTLMAIGRFLRYLVWYWITLGVIQAWVSA